MRLLIKQRVLSFTDSYDIYDENGETKYFVKADFNLVGHNLRVYDALDHEIGTVTQSSFFLLPGFDISINGIVQGNIQKEFSFFKPKYQIDYNGWRIEGDVFGWDYDVYSGCSSIIHITKELMHWGDTYVIDIADPSDELMGIMLVVAIDAANCRN